MAERLGEVSRGTRRESGLALVSDLPAVTTTVVAALCAWYSGEPWVVLCLMLALVVMALLAHALRLWSGARTARGGPLGSRVAGALSGLPTPGRGAVALGCVLITLVGLRTNQDLAGLDVPLPGRVSGVAELADDPTARQFGTSVTMVLGGRRWQAQIPRSHEHVVRGALMGERFEVEGTTRPLAPGFDSWKVSQHLSGRVDVNRIKSADGTRSWFRVANGFHRTLDSGARSLTDEQRSLYMGLVVGDDRNQSALTRHQFRASGLAHLSAVSGQNLVFVFAVLHPLSSRVPMRTRWAVLISAIALFVLVTRAEPSVMRAATMATFALGASLVGRRASGLRVLSLCILALLIADPLLVHSVGFQLSVGATLGLILLSRPLSEAIPGPEWISMPVAVTLAAQAGALIPLTTNFGATSLVSVPANVLAEPAAAGVMTLGLTAGFLAGLVRHPIDSILQIPVGALVSWIDLVATVASRVAMRPVTLAGWVCVGLAGFLALSLWRRLGVAALGRVMAVVAVTAVFWLRPSEPAATLPVANAIAGVDSCGTRVLVVERGDGVAALEDLWKLGVFRVDAVVGDGFSVSPEIAAQLRAQVSEVPVPDDLDPSGDTSAVSHPEAPEDLDSRRSATGGVCSFEP